MNAKTIRFFILLCICLPYSCNVFDPVEQEFFTTYITTVAGNGYDIAFDIIEVEDGYVLAGATGPQCDIVDAFMAKVDKSNGAIINLKRYGESNQGVEENFFSMVKVNSGFMAVGFSLKRLPPRAIDTFFCREENKDGKIFLASLDEELNPLSIDYLEMNDSLWDSGLDIIEDQQGNILIAGSWSKKIAVIQMTGGTPRVISSNTAEGDGHKLLQHSSGRLFLAGGLKIDPPGDQFKNIFWAEVDLENGFLVNEKQYFAPSSVDSQAVVGAIVETADRNLLLAGYIQEDFSGARKIFLLKTDLEGNQLRYDIVSLGINDAVNDIIAVEGGFVIAGATKPEGSTRSSDALIAMIDESGNVFWQASHDLRGGSDEAWKVIPTSDGGYLLSGQTFNRTNGIRSTMLIKTDGEGNVD